MKWLEPWEPVRNFMDEAYLLAWELELALETGPGHPLYQTKAKLIARRFDCDDALYQLEDGRVAMVHLTWIHAQERDPHWPETRIYGSLQAWEQEGLAADHADWRLDQS
ncbi:hypothetical protein [Ensifer aridi]|uniref:hypothetical protein n=1 Tax=Ensifer aridi TaxID=1708715 RepID=UPI0035901F08